MSICKRRVLKQLGFYKIEEIAIIMPRLAVILDCKGEKRQVRFTRRAREPYLPERK